MDRVQEFELWEKNKRREMQYIKTNVPDQPQIFYMPKEHNDKTMSKYEATISLIEEEIKTAKSLFEDELLKIENKLNADYFDENLDFDEEELDENEIENKPKSVIVKQGQKRANSEHNVWEPKNHEKMDKKVKNDADNIKVTIKNEKKDDNIQPAAKRIKTEPKTEKKRQKRRKDSSSSGSSGSSDSESDSSSSSDDQDRKKKIVIKTEK